MEVAFLEYNLIFNFLSVRWKNDGNTKIRNTEEAAKRSPESEVWYFLVLPHSRQGVKVILFCDANAILW